MKTLTLRDARTKRGLTQTQLEAASGIDQTVISRIERGENPNPTIDTVRKLEDALRLRRGTLVFGHEAEALSA